MFSLIRRISYGVIPRPDRPWEEDPTSNAPRTRRKRRYSSTEREADDDQANKKARGDSATPSLADAEGLSMGPPSVPQRDASEVKEVTEGVKEVDLDGKDPEDPVDREAAESTAFPESIPLPEERAGELDQPGSDDVSRTPLSSVSGVSEEVDAGEADAEDSDDVASSSDENTVVSEEDKLQKKKTVLKVLDPAESTIEQIFHIDTTKV
ncbi:hypothetical protein BYT27DRAFT_7244785 [Phlegmacium glaucopus]|nr:hypothetical protein BYT27DRAFT_7244785 [Phlegmacium glaucopus]